MTSIPANHGEAKNFCQVLIESITSLVNEELPRLTGVATPVLRIEATAVATDAHGTDHPLTAQRRLLVRALHMPLPLSEALNRFHRFFLGHHRHERLDSPTVP